MFGAIGCLFAFCLETRTLRTLGVQIENPMLCDRCQSQDATVHITTIMHVWFPVDRQRVVGGPTMGEDHLCPGCAQTNLAANPLLNPRTEPLPALGAEPVMSKPLRRLLDRTDSRHRTRFGWRSGLKRVWRRWTGR